MPYRDARTQRRLERDSYALVPRSRGGNGWVRDGCAHAGRANTKSRDFGVSCVDDENSTMCVRLGVYPCNFIVTSPAVSYSIVPARPQPHMPAWTCAERDVGIGSITTPGIRRGEGVRPRALERRRRQARAPPGRREN